MVRKIQPLLLIASMVLLQTVLVRANNEVVLPEIGGDGVEIDSFTVPARRQLKQSLRKGPVAKRTTERDGYHKDNALAFMSAHGKGKGSSSSSSAKAPSCGKAGKSGSGKSGKSGKGKGGSKSSPSFGKGKGGPTPPSFCDDDSEEPSAMPTEKDVSVEPSAGPTPFSIVVSPIPSSAPSVSAKPSAGPSPGPSVSQIPSAGPSPAPSMSVEPSVEPSAGPSPPPSTCPGARSEVSMCVSIDESESLTLAEARIIGAFGVRLIGNVTGEIPPPNSNFAANIYESTVISSTTALGPAGAAQAIFRSTINNAGFTNIEQAILDCRTQLNGMNAFENEVLVLVGDGRPTTCTDGPLCTGVLDFGPPPLNAATTQADAAKDDGILLITVFIGDADSPGFTNFQSFATPGGYAIRVDTFNPAALDMVVKMVVDSVVCGTPFT
jgi:hypothetical protein